MFPYSAETEKIVLSIVLKDPNKSKLLSEDWFHDPLNRTIVGAIKDLVSKGVLVDPNTVDTCINSNKLYSSKSGFNYVAGLANSEVNSYGLNDYLKQLKKLSINRNQIKALAGAQTALIDGDNVKYQQSFSEINKLSREESLVYTTEYSIADKTNAVFRALYNRYKNPVNGLLGIPSGVVYLDDVLLGFQCGDLIIVGARPSVGKSSLVTTVASNLVLTNPEKTMIIFSLEMPEEQLINRILSCLSFVPLSNIRTGKLTENQLVALAKAKFLLDNSNIIIDDRSSIGCLDINAKIDATKEKQSVDLVAVDYLQLMSGPGKDKREQVTNISRELKICAKDNKIPLIALSQLSRNNENRSGADREPRLSDLRESGSIEQDADIVVFIHRPEMYDPADLPGVAKLIVAKHRNGSTGSIYTAFLNNYTKIENINY